MRHSWSGRPGGSVESNGKELEPGPEAGQRQKKHQQLRSQDRIALAQAKENIEPDEISLTSRDNEEHCRRRKSRQTSINIYLIGPSFTKRKRRTHQPGLPER
jgi:hypothetical protein